MKGANLHIQCFSILVPDYDQGLSYFCGVLGFERVADIDQGRKRWVEVRAPGAQTSIVLARADTPEQVAAIGAQGGGRVWLFLHTDDFAADHARLTANGVTFEEAPRTEPYGTVAVFRDPFGNRWDLIQRT
ncbi:VOC family protein [uncultured Tateyamaria sp.]|uniref:VOC family protein n=1 Tax=uncultured Tateyamaria sp. TaxID=455651 RepID=UPI0026195B53|nr:VOC family protein [uncultured Tateyamaria sp.]